MEKETTKATPQVQRAHKPTRWAIVDRNGNEKASLELPGFDIKINAQTLQNPNTIAAIQNHERRKGIKVIGVRIKQV